ncbi:hypothetical protein GCM10023115_24260 [Pontixanthobacter gangjinensis]|uniref:Lipoprotein n=1 Tax=Pontixanthobacter gangjinensis TaxID=1028742 RepID=A0A6I4SRL8_9SPHN|nr:hypothetical protein [Pontixanthobacter gangjinensis]MXO57666.1 hypothetical protein [Pontixanthobacter gangjinensis]
MYRIYGVQEVLIMLNLFAVSCIVLLSGCTSYSRVDQGWTVFEAKRGSLGIGIRTSDASYWVDDMDAESEIDGKLVNCSNHDKICFAGPFFLEVSRKVLKNATELGENFKIQSRNSEYDCLFSYDPKLNGVSSFECDSMDGAPFPDYEISYWRSSNKALNIVELDRLTGATMTANY